MSLLHGLFPIGGKWAKLLERNPTMQPICEGCGLLALAWWLLVSDCGFVCPASDTRISGSAALCRVWTHSALFARTEHFTHHLSSQCAAWIYNEVRGHRRPFTVPPVELQHINMTFHTVISGRVLAAVILMVRNFIAFFIFEAA